MSSPLDPDDALRASLREAHEALDPPAPSFERLWSRAQSGARAGRTGPSRPRPGLRWALVTAFTLALLTPLLLPRLGSLLPGSQQENPTLMSEEEALRFAEDLSAWGSSLEFLDQAPGLELFDSFPQIYQLPRSFGDSLTVEMN